MIAISRTRARAWARNPEADPDDVALVVGSVDGRCQGYLGLVPGSVRWPGGGDKIYWISTLYVAPEARRSSIGALLLLEAVKLGRVLAVTSLSLEAERLCRALGFVEMPSVRYYELDLLRLGALAAPLRAIRRLIRVGLGHPVDALERMIARSLDLTGAVVFPLIGRLVAARSAPVVCNRVDAIPDAWFDASDAAAPCLGRSRNVLEWMMRWPWVSTQPEDATPGYFFGDASEAFEYRIVEFSDRSGPIGLAVLWLLSRHGAREIHVLDFATSVADPGPFLIQAALEHAAEFRATRLFLPDACRDVVQGSRLLRGLFRERLRRAFVRPRRSPDATAEVLMKLTPRYADGDASFA